MGAQLRNCGRAGVGRRGRPGRDHHRWTAAVAEHAGPALLEAPGSGGGFEPWRGWSHGSTTPVPRRLPGAGGPDGPGASTGDGAASERCHPGGPAARGEPGDAARLPRLPHQPAGHRSADPGRRRTLSTTPPARSQPLQSLPLDDRLPLSHRCGGAGPARGVRAVADGVEAAPPVQHERDLGQAADQVVGPGRCRWDIDWSVSVDSTINRAHQHGASLPRDTGGPTNYTNPLLEPAYHALGRSRGRLSTKVHHACDGRGRPLAVLVGRARPTTGRSCRSCSARSPCPNSGRDGPAPARMRSWPTRPTPRGRPGGCCALAASPRSSPNLATSRPTANAEADGVADRSARTPKAYKGRNVVERSLNALKQWPGLATRYEARRHLPRRRRPGRDPHLATRIRRRALDPLADHHGLAHAVARTRAALARTPSRRAR